MPAFTFRKRVLVRDSDVFMDAISKIEPGKLRPFIPVLVCLVESWEYAGDPHDPAAYDDLDVFAEFIPMVKAAEALIKETMGNQ